MYDQRRELGPDETKWPHRVLGGRQIGSVDNRGDKLKITVHPIQDTGLPDGLVEESEAETLEADLIIAATGYQRTAHIEILKSTFDLLPKAAPRGVEFGKGITGWNVETEEGERKLAVGRDYRVKYAPGSIAAESGIWLQGCCEGTHGVSVNLDPRALTQGVMTGWCRMID